MKENPDREKNLKTLVENNKVFENCDDKNHTYKEWKKVPITIKSKRRKEKRITKIKNVKQAKCKADFQEQFRNGKIRFIGHTDRIK